jgi:hypothetical protein
MLLWSITFLGHVVNVEGFYPDPKKIATMEVFQLLSLLQMLRHS